MTNNEPAFPVVKTEIAFDNDTCSNYPSTYSDGGLTKLEHFAGSALQGILANSAYHHDDIDDPVLKSKLAFRYAVAMLAEAERIQNENKD